MTKKPTKRDYWVQAQYLKRGVLSKQLGVPESKKIPIKLLNKIIMSKVGATITNPTQTGKRRIKVTRLLEKRSLLAKNLKNLRRK